MKTEYLKQIKETIKDFKNSRSSAKYLENNIIKSYSEQLSQYDKNNWFDNSLIETLIKRRNSEIYWLYESSFGNDSTIHIIYNDGSECCTTGAEIVGNECTPKLQHIVYAHYLDGDIEIDTEIGEFNWDISEDDQLEERDNYLNNIEIKYNTAWGIRHKNNCEASNN